MSCLSIFTFTYICSIVFSVGCSDLLQEIKGEQFADDGKNAEKSSDYMRRRVIAENYINTLASAKETWVDPYEMISFPVKEREELSLKPTDQSTDTISSSSILDNDDKPFFSDVRGDVIGKKVLSIDRPTVNDVESGGIFAKGRQQICVLDSIYVSRWLKKLILKIEKESDLEPSDVSFSLDSTVLENLKDLSTAKSLEISQLDDLICGLITQAVITRKEAYDWTIVYAYATDFIWAMVYIVSFVFILYVLYQSFMHRPKLTLLCCGLLLSVFWHWMHLYQQKKAYKHAELSSMKIPDQCRKHDFGLLEHIHEYLKSYFISNECAKYYEALLVDPFWEVSFTVAASEAVTAVMFQPLYASSRAINSAIKQLFDGLSIFMIVFLVGVIFLLIIMMCNYRIKLPFFMGALEPSYPVVGSCVEDVQPSNTLSMLKDKVCKTVSSIQGTHIKAILNDDSDVYAGSSNAWNGHSVSKSVQFLSNDTDVSSKLNTNSPSSVCLESSGSQTFGEPVSDDDDDNSESYSEDNSENSIDPHPCCSLCVIASSEMLQEMHAGCRVCESSANIAAGHAVENSESVSKKSENDNSFSEQSGDMSNTNECVPIYNRTFASSSKQGLYGNENVVTNSTENSWRH